MIAGHFSGQRAVPALLKTDTSCQRCLFCCSDFSGPKLQNMTLTVSPLGIKEVSAWAAVDDAAMADWPYAQAMGLGIQGSRVELVERWLRAGLHADPLQTYLKVTDEDTGELIAGALWRIGKDPPATEGKPSGVAAQDKAAQMAEAFTAARMQMWKAFQEEFFPDQAYASQLANCLHVPVGS